jgi:hypothetical protein
VAQSNLRRRFDDLGDDGLPVWPEYAASGNPQARQHRPGRITPLSIVRYGLIPVLALVVGTVVVVLVLSTNRLFATIGL